MRYRQEFLQRAVRAIGVSASRGTASDNVQRGASIDCVLLEWESGCRPLRKRQCGGWIADAQVRPCEICNNANVVWLFIKKGFEFAACLAPTVLCSGFVPCNFLRPTQPKVEFAVDVAQGRVRAG